MQWKRPPRKRLPVRRKPLRPRQLELLKQAIGAGVPPLGSFSAASDRSLLPPHLLSHVPPASFGHHVTPPFSAGTDSLELAAPVNATGLATPVNAGPPAGTPHPEEAGQE